MPTIVKTASGNWKAIIRIAGNPIVTKTFRIKKDSIDWARTTEDEIVRGIYISRSHSEKTTVSEAIQRYLDEVTPSKKLSTRAPEIRRGKIIQKHLGKYSLASLAAEHIASYRDLRIENGLSSNSIRLELALLSHLYTIAIKEWGMGLVVNPVSNVRKPKPGNGRDRRLNIGEEKRLLEACESQSNPMLAMIVKIALYTGMRHSEIVNLTRSQISLKNKTIFLPDTKNGTSRIVPLSNKTLEVLNEAINFPIRHSDTELLFFGEPRKEGIRKPYNIKAAWGKALKEANISDLRFHDLRHEATSRFVEAGLSDVQVSSITGHKSMQMLKRYTHLRTENLAELIADI